MSILRRPLTALRLTFRWSNSIQTWHERVGDLTLLVAMLVATLTSLVFALAWWQILAVWAFCLLLCVPLVLVGWLKVFGPVLYYDMIRQSRRTRFAVMRFLYILLLVFLLFNVAMSATNWVGRTDIHWASSVASTYFDVFMGAQFVTVVLLTPAYVAGAIAEEKERKTLEFMLATDLLNREIVLSKLLSRLANLAMVVLAGLPMLSILQFMGGVDPNLVLASFAVTAVTIAGQSGVSIFCSVICKRPRDAVALSYLAVLLYYGVAVALTVAKYTLPSIAGSAFFLEFYDLYNTGNLVAFMGKVLEAASAGTLATNLPILVRDYAIFHGLIAVISAMLAVVWVRRVGLAQTQEKATKTRRRLRLWSKPRVGLNPMLWKELYCEGSRRVLAMVVINLLLIIAIFAPAAIIIWEELPRAYGRFYSPTLAEHMNAWVRTANPVVGCLLLLSVAVRASTSITSERDKQTLDTLLTTPLENSTILGAKWVGSIFSVRVGLFWMAMIWILALVTGGMSVIVLPFVILAWFAYATFAGALGLWFSTLCRSSLWASVLSILTMIGVNGGHWIIWMCCAFALIGIGGPGSGIQHILMAHAGLLTPPFVMGMMPCSGEQLRSIAERIIAKRMESEELEMILFSMAGMVLWAAASFFVFQMAVLRFGLVMHRGRRIFANIDGEYAEVRRLRRDVVPLLPRLPPREEEEDSSDAPPAPPLPDR
jgi:ABC-type transport system involved in multi-copper enzyme maturation permease subunit